MTIDWKLYLPSLILYMRLCKYMNPIMGQFTFQRNITSLPTLKCVTQHTQQLAGSINDKRERSKIHTVKVMNSSERDTLFVLKNVFATNCRS